MPLPLKSASKHPKSSHKQYNMIKYGVKEWIPQENLPNETKNPKSTHTRPPGPRLENRQKSQN